MPINQRDEQETLSDAHGKWLENKYINVRFIKIDLSSVNDLFLANINLQIGERFATNKLAQANTRSRLRMVTLYQVATTVGGIVVGTGNKVEDYGVGFYTKYGDGGIDIAPIADLYKTEVWELGKYIGVDECIIDAPPTDGLWDDGRTDEDQIGTSYAMLEWVMERGLQEDPTFLNEEQTNAINIYQKFHMQNKHKMVEIPTFKL
jgi:NAD+ synthase